ncbi:hypothetical protein PVT68_04550 [Microbulbifer bruguierae]|uniref:Uncharacterized protein n=1 Tax=Microbulbifer bruguierae TaxID=3029061 RepID=A0ABY8NF52_9GAMM|nr:hypothetical protein [Microbulbifer bruguierae]WGL17564.1 hypothetical protein PVT68_04550 [Microbulbifer bruguierae]
MTGIPASLSPIQLHNRLNRPVWIGFKLSRRGKRQLVLLSAGNESGAQLSKNFETFVGQIVREFKLDPQQTDFVELRQEQRSGDIQANCWYRWHAHWVGSAPMECKVDPVTSETARSYLDQVLSRSDAAA